MNGNGESVSNGNLRDTRRPPGGILALPRIGALLCRPYSIPLTRGTKMEHTFIILEDKESCAPGDSDKGFCTEAPHIGVAGQNPVEQGAGETPLLGRNTCLLAVSVRRTLRARQRRSALSASKLQERTAVVLPKSVQGRLGLWRILLGTLAVANLCLIQADGHRLHKSPVHLGLNMDEDFIRLS